jgi:GT2 family glycosyltransferase
VALTRLSIIIPVHNAEGLLGRCLESVTRSAFPDYECIVVDDASTDQSRSIASPYGATLIPLDRNGGPAGARNRGAEQARGEILLFLDADVCVHTETLGQIDAHFRQHPSVDAVIGSYDDTPADPGFLSQYKNLFHHFVHHTSRTQAWTFWGGCGAIRRDVFLAAGGFDESYTRPCVEDIELGLRLRAQGRRIDLNPTIQVTHLKRWTFWKLLQTDLLNRGIPWFRLMLRHRIMPADLNVTLSHRLSVALVCAVVLLGATVIARKIMGLPYHSHLAVSSVWLAAAAAGLLLYLNLDLYRFFARQRGLLFAARALPMHWLYYCYCGVAAAAGLSLHLWDLLRASRLRRGLTFLKTTR